MTPVAPDVASSQDVPTVVPQVRRDPMVVRRRRSRGRHRHRRDWTAQRSHRRIIRAAVVCVGVLVVMALGLYFGLARQDITPIEGSHPKPAAAKSTSPA